MLSEAKHLLVNHREKQILRYGSEWHAPESLLKKQAFTTLQCRAAFRPQPKEMSCWAKRSICLWIIGKSRCFAALS